MNTACDLGYIYGTSCTATCDKGFTLIGAETKTCQRNKLWTEGDVKCSSKSRQRCSNSQIIIITNDTSFCHRRRIILAPWTYRYVTVDISICHRGHVVMSDGHNSTVSEDSLYSPNFRRMLYIGSKICSVWIAYHVRNGCRPVKLDTAFYNNVCVFLFILY